MGTSISSRHSQSGFEAEEERAATADSMLRGNNQNILRSHVNGESPFSTWYCNTE